MYNNTLRTAKLTGISRTQRNVKRVRFPISVRLCWWKLVHKPLTNVRCVMHMHTQCAAQHPIHIWVYVSFVVVSTITKLDEIKLVVVFARRKYFSIRQFVLVECASSTALTLSQVQIRSRTAIEMYALCKVDVKSNWGANGNAKGFNWIKTIANLILISKSQNNKRKVLFLIVEKPQHVYTNKARTPFKYEIEEKVFVQDDSS